MATAKNKVATAPKVAPQQIKDTVERLQKDASQKGYTVQDLEAKRKELVKTYIAEEKIPIILAPSYAAHFGNIMRVSINGVTVSVRVDGSTQKIPKSFADEVNARRRTIDRITMRMKRMSEVSSNYERSPGELKF